MPKGKILFHSGYCTIRSKYCILSPFCVRCHPQGNRGKSALFIAGCKIHRRTMASVHQPSHPPEGDGAQPSARCPHDAAFPPPAGHRPDDLSAAPPQGEGQEKPCGARQRPEYHEAGHRLRHNAPPVSCLMQYYRFPRKTASGQCVPSGKISLPDPPKLSAPLLPTVSAPLYRKGRVCLSVPSALS